MEPQQVRHNLACAHTHTFGYLIFFIPFNFISWRLITLQYCSGFCHTLTWISHGVTCVPHPNPPSRLPPHPIPLGLPSALVSCIQPGLVVCFTLDSILDLLIQKKGEGDYSFCEISLLLLVLSYIWFIGNEARVLKDASYGVLVVLRISNTVWMNFSAGHKSLHSPD